MKKYYINKGARNYLLFVFSILAFVGAAFLIKTCLKDKYVDRKEPVFSYINKSTINYNVDVDANSIYNKNNIGEGNIYISDYVQGINTTLKYNFNSDKEADISGTYEAVIVFDQLIGNDKNSKILNSYREEVIPKTEFKFKGKSGEQKKEFSLDFKKYSTMLKDANNKSGLNISGKISLVWNISIKGNSDSGAINETLAPKLEIPLGEKYFEIGSNLTADKKGSIEKSTKIISPNYKKLIYIFSGLIIGSALILMYLLIFTLPKRCVRVSAEKTLKVLKNYKERLVALKEDPTDGNEIIISVMAMDDLVKIADDLEKPIFYTYSSNIEEVTSFYIIENRRIYLLQVV